MCLRRPPGRCIGWSWCIAGLATSAGWCGCFCCYVFLAWVALLVGLRNLRRITGSGGANRGIRSFNRLCLRSSGGAAGSPPVPVWIADPGGPDRSYSHVVLHLSSRSVRLTCPRVGMPLSGLPLLERTTRFAEVASLGGGV